MFRDFSMSSERVNELGSRGPHMARIRLNGFAPRASSRILVFLAPVISGIIAIKFLYLKYKVSQV